MRWVVLVVAAVAAIIIGREVVGSPRSARETNQPAAPALPIRSVCTLADVPYPPRQIFIRAFKEERELELWGADKSGKMQLLRTYPIAAASGGPGPKRREGDQQVPEGVYRVDQFNPHSRFHLSLRVNYPNKADRILGDRANLGGDIYIHGNQVSIGCLAMTDPKIEEIYSLASTARPDITVHIFPCRMEGGTYAQLKRRYPALAGFWKQLQPIYAAFEAKRVVPQVRIMRNGVYRLAG